MDKGLGVLVLCSALLRNAAEGSPGRYFGTDKNPDAGFLLAEPYTSVGQVLYGDSIESLRSIPEIDIFINDSDHSAEYVGREYETIAHKLGKAGGLILGDNAHCTDVLAKFSEQRGRQFFFFHEQPENHWYPGAGIGISFVGRTQGLIGALTDVRRSDSAEGRRARSVTLRFHFHHRKLSGRPHSRPVAGRRTRRFQACGF